MNKNKFAITPPMGWNSYDYYDTTVNEEQVKANADYMAANLKEFGWKYIVVDIAWYSYDMSSQRDKHQYIPFWKAEMDEYSRLLPCPERFPSSIGGKGFKPLADYVHNLGLKFGIHIMRGIPRIAAHVHTKILGIERTADKIASPNNICLWNPDMYGVLPEEEGAQEYYDSIFALYAEWEVDFIKCDDICRMDMPTAKKEIEMLHKSIMKTGRQMILSLSPGPAKIEEAWHYEKYSNMWRITDDFWDTWPLLKNMFGRCELWQNHVSEGCFPDCDMLPLGYLGKGFGKEYTTKFTREEQITMMTLWSIFRSPLMIGAELTKLDEWTLGLLTNKHVLRLLTCSKNARQLERDDKHAVWLSQDTEDTSKYLAVFNFEEENQEITVAAESCGIESYTGMMLKELWTNEIITIDGGRVSISVPSHGARLYKTN